MREMRICVAGVEVGTEQHLRPVVAKPERLGRDLLHESGGPFELGAVVELGEVRPQPDPPAIEDHLFQPQRARRLGRLDGDRYLELLERISHRNLRNAFGPELKRRGERKYATDLGQGERTLACVKLRGPLALEIDSFGKLSLRFEEAGRPANAPLTDLRFFEPDQDTIRHRTVDDVSARLRGDVDVWVMFGLARAWQASNDDAERHWLQVNGLCLGDRPLGPQP
jgi:Dual OB-containing domain